jgi:hypothetical protein
MSFHTSARRSESRLVSRERRLRRLHISELLYPKATTGIAEKTQTPHAFAGGPHKSSRPTTVPDTPSSKPRSTPEWQLREILEFQ